MPQLNSDEAANDEPTPYSEECGGEDDRWNENLSDIKGDLVEDIDKYPRGAKNNAGESSNSDRMDRADDSRDETKVPGRPYIYPPDIGSIVSSMQPFFQNGGLPPTSKVPYAYNPYHHLFYGSSAAGDIESKTGLPRGHRPDIPSMYSLPGQLGQIPHPLAPWPAPPIYPICTASTISPMLSYTNPFAAAFSSAAAAAASNMPRFPHRPGMHPTMIPHPALVSNGLGNMANGQHPHHGKHDDKPGRHSKGDSESGRSKRDRPYVKKPLNAFMLYMKEQRAKVVAECTLKESAAINQILGRKWHSLSREEQQKYYEMARKERQLHLQMYPGWSARDNYGKRKKRKKEKNQGECTAQNPKKCRAVFGLEQQQLWCAPCRRKKKCIRYQHDDDSDEDDFSPLNSPHQFQSYQQQNPFDPVRTTSPPLSLTSSTNGEFNSSASSSARSNHSLNASGSRPEIKQEYRASPTRGDRMSPMPNGANHDLFNGRPNGRNSSSDNSFKSENSPNNHESGNQGNHRHLGNNDNNNNNRKEHPQRQMQNFCAENGNSLRRQTSAPPIGSDHRSSFRKTNSHENSDLPGPSGLNARRNSDRRFLFYLVAFSYGMGMLWQSTWFWDTRLCWENFRHQEIFWPEFIYYMMECSFYLSLLFSIMTDIKRKDFTEQLIHHIVTLTLITCSYLMTYVRVGTLVMAVHDISDIFLELAKCFNYMKKQVLAENLFTIFAVIFVTSRLVIYPFWVIHTSAIKYLEVTGTSADLSYCFFNGLLIVLLCLHIFWASIIFNMAKEMITNGTVKKDHRSDTEDEDTEEEKDEATSRPQ